MKQANMFILTGDIQTGKSDALMRWVETKSAQGFITPTVNGIKMFYHLTHKTFYDYEVAQSEHTMTIGNYHLSSEAFRIAEQIIHDPNAINYDWFVVDEIGKLELRNQGHATLLRNLCATWQSNLLLVVRENLLADVLDFFELKSAQIISIHDLLNLKNDCNKTKQKT
jgi:nucleoside-triphosphatase THEP1